ncbi:hypothetical protein L3X38_035089 [Prunus dulcis]|uniref:Uncharacterized protein n=1 Tax=Prunus dulcis TaxID=3755 RepID=A0AAD4VJ14_PRUDU|nr:hypothetical protein L3X38_035089 [Prunus dulcis]
MSDIKSDYSDSPRAFEGELDWKSLTAGLESCIFSSISVSLKWPTASKRDVETIESVSSKIAEEDRFFKNLLDFSNLLKAGMISEPEHNRKEKERNVEEEKNKTEVEVVREAYLRVIGKRQIEGAVDLTPLPKRPMEPNEDSAILIPGDEMEGDLYVKRTLNAAERYQKKYEDSRAKLAEASKAIQDADRYAEENAAKITKLSSKLTVVEVALVETQEAKKAVEVAMDAAKLSRAMEVHEAKAKAVVDYRTLEEFTALLDKEVMDQFDNLMYQFKP